MRSTSLGPTPKSSLHRWIGLRREQLERSAGSSEANEQLIALLRERIEELEAEKQQSDTENQRQDDKIKQLETKLSHQQSLIERMMKQMRKLMPKGS